MLDESLIKSLAVKKFPQDIESHCGTVTRDKMFRNITPTFPGPTY